MGVRWCIDVCVRTPGDMAKFDPQFWELPVDPEVLDRFEAAPPYDELEDAENERRAEVLAEAVLQLRTIVSTHLTDKQHQILTMYYFDRMTQQAIAGKLGIAQQVVSKHLFGVVRDGKKVGGALKRLRKAMKQLHIDPEKWV